MLPKLDPVLVTVVEAGELAAGGNRGAPVTAEEVVVETGRVKVKGLELAKTLLG